MGEQFALLHQAFIGAYYDVGFGQSSWLWLWYRPITIGFTIIFAILSIMKAEKIGKATYLVTCTILLLVLSLTHFSEIAIFVVILVILSMVTPKIGLRTKETAYSVIMSLILSNIISLVYLKIFGSKAVTLNLELTAVLVVLSLLCIFLSSYTRRIRLKGTFNNKVLTSFALLIYGIVIVFWLTNYTSITEHIRSIITSPTGETLALPISVLPVLLGITGILTIPAIVLILSRYRNHSVVIFPIIFIIVLIIGKIITYLNINIVDMNYWERRLIPFLWFSGSIMASVTIIKITEFVRNKRVSARVSKPMRELIITVFIGTVVVTGILSTFLTIEYQLYNSSKYSLTSNEKMFIEALDDSSSNSSLLTLSSRMNSISEYSKINYVIGSFQHQIWPSISPEMPLNVLSGLNNSALIYLNDTDYSTIYKKGYEKGYVFSHLMNSNLADHKDLGFGNLIQIPPLSPPTANSNMVLILPNDNIDQSYNAYHILAGSKFNFTTANIFDIQTIKKADILIAPSKEIAFMIADLREIYNLAFTNLIILNLDDYSWDNSINSVDFDDGNNFSDTLILKTSEDNVKYDLIINRSFSHGLNLNKYDFIVLNWNNINSHKGTTLQFISTPDNYFQFEIRDTGEGDREILLPISELAKRMFLNNYLVTSSVKGIPNWANINSIHLNSSSNSAVPNVNLDNLSAVQTTFANKIYFNHDNKTKSISIKGAMVPTIADEGYNHLVNFSKGIPFISKIAFDGFNVYKVDAFQLLQNLNLNANSHLELLSAFREVMDSLELNYPKYRSEGTNPNILVSGGVSAFRNAVGHNLTVNSASASVLVKDPQILTIVDGDRYDLPNLKQIIPIDSSSFEGKSGKGIIHGFSGFYSTVNFPEKSEIKFIGSPTRLLLVFDDESPSIIEGNNVTFKVDSADIISRNPSITIRGQANFSDFYSYGDLYKKIKVLGKDLTTEGTVNLKVQYSDQFVVGKTSIDGDIINPISTYYSDIENGQFINKSSIGIVFGLICIFIGYLILIRKRDDKIWNSP
jgi:hypothetical protein